mmetsp:Transcript_118772/g.369064  ORF Transcript_118772/g.369064 Transcript_118772/m.369064 type:complete len:384 (+) Transcript_118772:65-1216(+)
MVPEAPGTVGEAVAVAMRKELLHLWAGSDPASLSAEHTDVIVQCLAPALAQSLVAAARRRFPSLAVEAGSRLPEAALGPAPSSVGGAAEQELREELQGFLGSHDLLAGLEEQRARLKREVAPLVPMSHPWQRWLCGGSALLLPAGAVACLCAAAASALLATCNEPDVGLGEPDEALPAGSPRGLARALRCRRRVFALERELIARERAEREREAFERAERQKSEERLMEVNRQLEERLRARTEELRRAGQRIIEAQRSLDDARAQLNERKREITQLRYQLEQDAGTRQESLAREQEHGRALLRSAAREAAAREAARRRAEKLRRCLGGEAAADLLREPSPEDCPELLARQLEVEVQERLRRKQERCEDRGAYRSSSSHLLASEA